MGLKSLRWLNVAAVILTIIINVLANALPLNGLNTGQISDRFEVYFVPAGYVFSIWGLIYIGLIAFAVYQALPSQLNNPRLARIGFWFIGSCLANIVWIFLWHYEVFPLTIVAMLVLLACLITIYLRLNIGRSRVSTVEKACVDTTFSIYLGWITVATIANVTSLLDFLGWNGWGIAPQVWAAVMLIAALIVATLMTWTRRDVAYLLVLIWAVIGIALKHAATPAVAITSWVVVVLLAAETVFALLRRRTA